jgi:hypothetical protein
MMTELSFGRHGVADGAAPTRGCTSTPLSTGAAMIAVGRADAVATAEGIAVAIAFALGVVLSAAGAAPQ